MAHNHSAQSSGSNKTSISSTTQAIVCIFPFAFLPGLPDSISVTHEYFPSIMPDANDILDLIWQLVQTLIPVCLLGALIICAVVITLLAFTGWRENGAKWENFLYVLWAAISIPLTCVIGPIVVAMQPVLFIGLVTLLIILSVLNIVFKGLIQSIQKGMRRWRKYGKLLFGFILTTPHPLLKLLWRELRFIETIASLVLANHANACRLVENITLHLLNFLNLTPVLLWIFSFLACHSQQTIKNRREAIRWIGKMATSIPKNQICLQKATDRLLKFSQDTSWPGALRFAAAYTLSSFTFTPAHHSSWDEKADSTENQYAVQAWQTLAKDSQISPPLVRIAAIRTLCYRFKRRREIREILHRILATPTNHRQEQDELLVRAAWLLGQIASPQKLNLLSDRKKAVEHLRYYSSCTDYAPRIRYFACSALGMLGEQAEAGALLYCLACDAEFSIRQQAVASLYRLRQQDQLCKLANQSDWKEGQNLQTRLRATEFLSYLNCNLSAGIWLEIARQTTQPTERIRAARQALLNGESQARQILWQIGEGNIYPSEHRLLAAEVLARCHYLEDARLIYMVLSYDMSVAPEIATQALGKLMSLPR